MKLCYCDESGTGSEPYAVMAGFVVDAQRMHVTKREWEGLLDLLSEELGRKVTEFHTREFYPGNGIWRGLNGPQRSTVMNYIADWIAVRRHSVIITACDKASYSASAAAGQIPAEANSVWRFLATHLILAVQKQHQSIEKTKGHTLLVFDQERAEEALFADLVLSPPAWTDTYYSCARPDSRLSHIIDVPYFADSRHVGLIQIADYIAYVVRRHLELTTGRQAERYVGEASQISGWATKIASRTVPAATLYPEKGRCTCADMFFNHAPADIRSLLRSS